MYSEAVLVFNVLCCYGLIIVPECDIINADTGEVWYHISRNLANFKGGYAMGRKSTIENPSVYLKSREEAGMTRAQASEVMHFSESSLEKIERGTQRANPDDIVLMADAYRKPALCNYYCANECEIGKISVPAIEVHDLSQIILNMLSKLNAIEKEKNALIDITADGIISQEEKDDFARIQEQLEQLSITVEALKLWVKQSIANAG